MKSLTPLVIALLIASPLPARAQTPAEKPPSIDWADVLALKPGAELVVKLADNKPLRRRLVLADETQLTLQDRGQFTEPVENIARSAVVEISSRVGTGRPSTGATIGSAVLGFVGGAVIGGFLGYHLNNNPNEWFSGVGGSVVGVSVGAPIGAIAAGIAGHRHSSRRAEQVVYRVKQEPR